MIESIALATVAVAAIAAVSAFAWALYRERGLRAESEVLLANQNEMNALAHADEMARKLDVLVLSRAEAEKEKTNDDKTKIADAASDGVAIAVVGASVWATMPKSSATDDNPLGADLPASAVAEPASPKRRR
jgi:hypothetical protein